MTDSPTSVDRIDAIVARVAIAYRDKVAVSDAGGNLTYGELWRRAQDTAAALRAGGLQPGDPVGVYGQASRDSVTAMLGVLIAGGCYVPIDPTFPDERARWLLAVAGARVLLLADDDSPASDLGISTWHVGEAPEGGQLPAPAGTANSTMYIMFTSGSTGQSNPVAVAHAGIARLLLRPSPLRARSEDGLLAGATLAFDTSVLEVWAALVVGASVVCARAATSTLRTLAAALADPRVTMVQLNPAVFALMVDHHLDAMGGLRLLSIGGDVMPTRQTASFRAAYPQVMVVNSYGPTEACVVSAVFDVQGWDRDQSATVPIGYPLAGSVLHVLDDELRAVPAGDVGELVIGGDRLALGYPNDHELTASRFVDDPYTDRPGARMYRTGDRVRVLPSGALEFLGRTDAEVKVRGYRVNLTESQVVLAADPSVAEAVVVPVGEPGDRSLIGFVRPQTPGLDVDTVRRRAWQRAPRYVVPDRIVVLDSYPIGCTGKIDKQALIAWAETSATTEQPPDADADTPTEPVAEDNDADELSALWTARAGLPPEPGKDFFHSGGTSLGLIQLIEDIAGRFGIDLDFADVYGLRSVDELLDLVRAAREHAIDDAMSASPASHRVTRR